MSQQLRAHTVFIIVLLIVVTMTPYAAELPFGWRVGPAAWSFKEFTFYEAVDKTASMGMAYIEAFEGQQVHPEGESKLNADLSDDELRQIRTKLAEAKVTLTSIYIHRLPGEEDACRRAFAFAQKLGAAFIVSEPEPEALDLIERLCEEFDINVAIHNHPEGSSRYWHPNEVMKVCEGRSARIGACADTGHWLRSGLNPAEGIRLLGDRLLSVHLKDLDKAAPDAEDRPWGQGCGDMEQVLRTIQELRLTPGLFTVEYESHWENNLPQIQACGTWLGETAAVLAAEMRREDPLFVGWAMADINPRKPVALAGQKSKRLAKTILDPLTATALALETRGPDGETSQAVIVSVDLVKMPLVVAKRIQARAHALVPELAPESITLSATHTHTAPVLDDHAYDKVYTVGDEPGEMLPSAYCDFFVEQTAQAIAEAWANRAPGGMSWGLGHAVVGVNRRAQYADGTTVMYGKTYLDHFQSFEGDVDPGVEMLFFWTEDKTLTGTLINLACPSQETESLREASADFWHDIRQEIHKRHGDDLYILPQCAAAGDLSPHRLFRKKADKVMLTRFGLSHRQLIAQRVADAFDMVLPTADTDIKYALTLTHDVVELDLPEVDPPRPPFGAVESVHPIRFHVLRIGDVAMATNPFELYLDYGFRIKARSTEPVLTFIVQLANGSCGYLPTTKAVAGGGYSAEKFVVGPEGGQVLVDTTVRRIGYLWP